MLNFFVLGLIPGTHLQITYIWLLVAMDLVATALVVFVVYEYTWLKPRFLEHVQKQTKKNSKKSGAKSKLAKAS